MKIACPACRADNTERTCRRCKADLSLLWNLEAERDHLLSHAAEALHRHDWTRATELAQQALDLRSDRDAMSVIACAYLLRWKFHRALEWHARATGGRMKDEG